MSTFFLLFGMINFCVLISGKPGTCEKIGKFQCKNGKCIDKDNICNSFNNCGDNSDESMKDGVFCGRHILLLLDSAKNKVCNRSRSFSFKITF